MISVLVVGKCSYECSVNLAQTARAFGASDNIRVKARSSLKTQH